MQNGLKSGLKRMFPRGIVIGLLSLAMTYSHAGILNTGFSITYEVTHNDIVLGDAVRSFKSKKDGRWEYLSNTHAKGFARMFLKDTVNEASQIKQVANNYQPLSYRYHQHGGKKEKKFNIHFDWTNGQINNDYTNKQYPLKAGTHDLLSFQIQLMRDLQNNKQAVTYIISDKKRVDSYSLKVVNKAKLETPFKTLDTIKLISNRIRNKMQFIIWCAPELNYLPVRILKVDDDGDTTELNLKTVSF